MDMLSLTRAMRFRMLHCELKWEIPIKALEKRGGNYAILNSIVHSGWSINLIMGGKLT